MLLFYFKAFYCFAAQVTKCRSKLFAQRLFECLDADNSGDISLDELLDVMHVLQTRDSEKRIAFIFRLFDLDGDGVLTAEELAAVLKASIQESDVSVTEEEEENLIEALTDLFDENKDGLVSYLEFHSVLVDYPDVLEGLSLEGIHCSRVSEHQTSGKNSRGRNQLWNWLSNNPQVCFTYGVTVIAVIASLLWRFSLYTHGCDDEGSDQPGKYFSYFCSNVRKRRLMGWSLPLAKGCVCKA